MARRNRWANRAALEALLKYGPAVGELADLQRAAQSDFSSSVKGARASAHGTVQAVRAARPEIRDVYADAKGASQGVSDVIGDTSGLPASMQAALTQEQTGFGNRLAEERADALTDLTSRGVAAREGKGAAIRAARDDYAGQLQQILAKRLDLAGQQGTYTSLRTSELQDEAQKRADQFALKQLGLDQSERNSIRSSGVDPDTGKPLPGKGPKSSRPRATETQIGAAQDHLGTAQSWITRLQKAGLDRGDISTVLQSGREERTIALHDPSTGKPLYNTDGTPKTKKISGVPKIESVLLLSAALDQAFGGFVSKKNQSALHRRGIYIRDLGLTPWEKRKKVLDPWGSGHTHT